jgi:hypothetical protein
MTLDQFVKLNEMEKVSAIMQYGHLIAQNVDNDSRIFFYRLESFFVSASYSRITDQLEEINSFLEANQAVPHYRKLLISINPAERQYNTPEC